MEARLLIAYMLIGLSVAAAALLVRHFAIKRREYRRLMRGHRGRARASPRR
jgi:hypothetical protein